MRINRYALAAIAAALAGGGVAHATHGYFAYGYGTKSKGMAGAGVALPLDSLQAAVNPAGMVWLGNRFDVGAGIFSIRPQYRVKGAPSGAPGTLPLVAETVKGKRGYIFVPDLGVNKMLDPNGSVGLSMYTNGGADTSYPGTAGGGHGSLYGGPTGVKLEQFFIQASYARKFNPKSSWGLGLVSAIERFGAHGLSHFAPFVADGTPDHLTNNGEQDHVGFGWKAGVQAQAAKNLTLAASYQSKIKVPRFKQYEDLIAQGGRLDVPPTATIGLAYKTSPRGTLAFDVQEIWYTKVPSLSNPFANIAGFKSGDASKGLGGENGIGLGWKDVTAVKLGYQCVASPKWTYRAGVDYGKQPIRSSEVFFNLIAPGVEEWHYTIGATHTLKKGAELSVAALYAPITSVTGYNPLEAKGQQSITLKQGEIGLEVSFGKAF
ncbi:MAG TPA: outer membrane protein transport protein [Armatimonadota bacterium]